MNDFQAERLERIKRYLINTSRFLWDSPPKKKDDDARPAQSVVYEWLKEAHGLHFDRGNYSSVTRQLLGDPGIASLLKDLIGPTIREQFPKETLDTLRNYWNIGRLPKKEEIDSLNVLQRGRKDEDFEYKWRPFLEIIYLPKTDTSASSKYVSRWGELAGVWFEEIEPWLNEKETQYPG